MAEPSTLRVKRKATEDAPSILILEPQLKRAATKLHYVRKTESINADIVTPETDIEEVVSEQQNANNAVAEPIKREFQLSRERNGNDGRDSVATFMEKERTDQDHAGSSFEASLPAEAESPQKQLRKPSARAAFKGTNKLVQQAETDAERKRMEEMSEYMQNEFVEEVKHELRPADAAQSSAPSKQIKPPKLSGRSSKEIHRQRAAAYSSSAAGKDVHMTDDSDYVYDTYILATAGDAEAAKIEALTDLANVGYLVIAKEDESLWQTYLEDDLSDSGGGDDTDDDDENAEDFYGADYPEDELASDDEFDRNNYAYRGRGAFDEEYDEDTGAYSDDDDEFERTTNPFGRNGIPKRFEDWT